MSEVTVRYVERDPEVTVRYVDPATYDAMCQLAAQGYNGDQIDATLGLPPIPSPQPRQTTHEQPNYN